MNCQFGRISKWSEIMIIKLCIDIHNFLVGIKGEIPETLRAFLIDIVDLMSGVLRGRSEVNYCEEAHGDIRVLATNTHPESSRLIHLCDHHYREATDFFGHEVNELSRAYERSCE